MKVLKSAICLAVTCVTSVVFSQGQQAASMEFLQATSPLKSGGQVTVYSTPNQGLTTSFTATNGIVGRDTSSQSQAPSANGPLAPNSGVPTAANPETGSTQVAANIPPVLPATPMIPADPFAANNYNTVTLPTLGVTPTSGRRPNWWKRAFGTSGSNPVQIAPPPAMLPPQLAGNSPALLAQPQTGTVPSGSNVIQPLIRLQNMPPGTYTGQGLLGQPKAFVDGQPARNLLRYLLPF